MTDPLGARVRRLESIAAIKRLQHEFGFRLAAGDVSGAAALFAPDGAVEVSGEGGSHGRERIAERLARLIDPGASDDERAKDESPGSDMGPATDAVRGSTGSDGDERQASASVGGAAGADRPMARAEASSATSPGASVVSGMCPRAGSTAPDAVGGEVDGAAGAAPDSDGVDDLPMVRAHLQIMPVITVAADDASGQATWRDLDTGGGPVPAYWAEGPQEVSYVRSGGRWWIRRLHWLRYLHVPYDGGWQEHASSQSGRKVDAGAAWNAASPGDDQTTARWPEIFRPPFHFLTSDPAAPSDPATDAPGVEADEADLAQRIQSLEDERAIENLVGMLGYYLDKERWAQAARLFAGEMTLPLWSAPGAEGPRQGVLRDTMFAQITVTVTGDSASARWRAFAQWARHGEGHEWGLATLEADLVRTGAGWRITRLDAPSAVFTPYDEGWSRAQSPASTVFGDEGLRKRRDAQTPASRRPAAALEPAMDRAPRDGTAPAPCPDRLSAAERATQLAAAVAPVPTAEAVPADSALPGDPSSAADAVPDTVGAVPDPAEPASVADFAVEPPPDAGPAAAADLDLRLRRLEAAAEIERTQNVYGYCLATFEWERLAGLFTDDGVIEVALRGVYRGRESVRRNLDLYGTHAEHGVLHNHMQLQPVIHVDAAARRATLRARSFSMMGAFGASSRWAGGIYDNVYVATPDGWRIAADRMINTYFAPYATGWKDLPPRDPPGISTDIPPDGPPSEHFVMYPRAQPPAYPYPHPE